MSGRDELLTSDSASVAMRYSMLRLNRETRKAVSASAVWLSCVLSNGVLSTASYQRCLINGAVTADRCLPTAGVIRIVPLIPGFDQPIVSAALVRAC